MAETRIRGQEVSLRLTRNGNFEGTLTAIKDFTMQYDFATLEEGYLGETTMRKDDIFNGVSGSFTIEAEGQEVFLFLEAIKARTQNRATVNQNRINATAFFTFPNGQTPQILIRDLKFDAAPINVSDRQSYVNVSLSYKAEDARVLAV